MREKKILIKKKLQIYSESSNRLAILEYMTTIFFFSKGMVIHLRQIEKTSEMITDIKEYLVGSV